MEPRVIVSEQRIPLKGFESSGKRSRKMKRKIKCHRGEGFEEIEILNYSQMELMKEVRTSKYEESELVDYSHWQRFLGTLSSKVIGPTFEEYRRMLKEFPGWSYGPMRPSHSAWKKGYLARELPMNKYYR